MITLRTFLELNEGMALRAVLDALQAVEADWNDPRLRQERFVFLLEILSWANLHRSEKVRELYYQNPEFGFYLVGLITERLMDNARKLKENPTAAIV